MTKLLLINPWVDDFAHYNLWSAPLGLYRVAEYLSQFDADIQIIDCTDARIKCLPDGRSQITKVRIDKPRQYATIPRYYYRFGISEDEFMRQIETAKPFDAVLMTSIMAYWYPGVAQTIRVVKKMAPLVPVILGGIYATLYPEHARLATGSNAVYKGSAGQQLIGVLDSFGIGLNRIQEGAHWSRYALPNVFAPIKTSDGCPFGCTYCATSVLSPKFIQYPVSQAIDEIALLHKMGIRHFPFYDDALLVNAGKHLLPILSEVTHIYNDANFYTPVGLNAKMITGDVARALKSGRVKHIRIGYETHDSRRQEATGGKTGRVDIENALSNLTEAGYYAKDTGVFVMYGLPDQSLEEVLETVQFLKRKGVRISLSEYSPITGTIDATKVPAEVLSEPLYSNNTAYSLLFADYDKDRLERIKMIAKYR